MSRHLLRCSHTAAWLASAAVALLCSACDAPPQPSPPAQAATAPKPSVAPEPTTASIVAPPAPAAPAAPALQSSDVWQEVYLLGTKIGYNHTGVRPLERDGRQLLQVMSEGRVKLLRFDLLLDQSLKLTTLETPAGAVLEFRTEYGEPPRILLATGRVSDGVMKIESFATKNHKESKASKGPQESTLSWSDDIGGFAAIELSLERHPMQPGENRSLKMLMPIVNQVADVELAAVDYESTRTLERTLQLLRIETVARLADGKETVTTYWTDESGRALKSRDQHSQEESYRTSRETAIFTGPRKFFDVGKDVMVKLAKPLRRGHRSRQIRYQIELEDADPATLFSIGLTQSVQSVDAHTAEVTVRCVPPSRGKSQEAKPDAHETPSMQVDPQYLCATSVLETGDPKIQAMARQAQGDLTNPHEIALNLERYVKRAIVHKDYSQLFATAAEVAGSRRGDCTEHSVLLAALARVCGIPSRVAMGLVYVEQSGGFGYHMWNEVLLDGKWIPLDATLGMGGIGAGHLKLADSSLDGPTAQRVFAAGAKVIGHVKIKVLEAE